MMLLGEELRVFQCYFYHFALFQGDNNLNVRTKINASFAINIEENV